MNATDFPTSPELSVIQQWFQSVITHPDGVQEGMVAARSVLPLAPHELERIVTRSARLGATERLAVYANAYQARLMECLGEVFPLVRRVVGESGFGDFAVDYLQDFPPRSYTLNGLGRHFAAYLARVRPPREAETAPDWADFVIELARFEWELFEVFDGPGVEGQPPFQFAALAELSPEQWNEVRLQPAPCLRLLKSRFPLNDFFSTARGKPDGEELVAPDPLESQVALTRREFVVRRHALSAPEHRLLSALVSGSTLGAAFADGAANSPDQVEPELAAAVQGWFARWGREQFFTGFELGVSG